MTVYLLTIRSVYVLVLYLPKKVLENDASVLNDAKALPLKELKETMGHSASMDTNRYVHPVSGAAEKEAQAVTDIFNLMMSHKPQ